MIESGKFSAEETKQAREDYSRIHSQFIELLRLVPNSWRRWVKDYGKVKTQIRQALERGDYLPQ